MRRGLALNHARKLASVCDRPARVRPPEKATTVVKLVGMCEVATPNGLPRPA